MNLCQWGMLYRALTARVEKDFIGTSLLALYLFINLKYRLIFQNSKDIVLLQVKKQAWYSLPGTWNINYNQWMIWHQQHPLHSAAEMHLDEVLVH